ncbi:U-box domain-containing protein 40-like [Coffea eugenioides]|uniref:U-box domain-containing protein 40-like n=1 Tax=Coffea eugenioides TaxID=49369 RepID=UPI000F60D3D3|nr:U-box domain-containing protein 40-like [Coffea eugenioides]
MGSGAKQKQLPKWKIHFEKSPKQKIQPPLEFVCPIPAPSWLTPLLSPPATPSSVTASMLASPSTSGPPTSIALFPISPPSSLTSPSSPLFSAGAILLSLPLLPNPSSSARTLLLASRSQQKPNHQLSKFSSQETELTRTPSQVSASSKESVTAATVINRPTTPLPLTTRPYCCYCSSSSSDIESLCHSSSLEEDKFMTKLRSSQVFEQEEALLSLRKLTQTQEESRVNLYTACLLSALRPLITSKYASV